MIPARNEAETIAATLRGLAHQGPGLEVRIVDDESSDGTALRARETAAVLAESDAAGAFALAIDVVAGRALPPGWGGKLWALQQGLEQGCRAYTLLLDADIVLEPRVVPALLRRAEERRAALVSIMAKLRCESLWEKLLVPPFIFFFKLLYPFTLAADPRSRVAGAAGGCILVETAALVEIEAFASIRAELIDDCALARRVKRRGHGLWLGQSDSVRSLRRYERLGEFWEMVSRTAYTQLNYSVWLLLATSLLMAWLFVLPFVALAIGPAAVKIAAVLAWLAMAGVFWPTVRAYGLGPRWALSLPAAATLMLAMTWSSAIHYWGGTRARWKARSYDAS